MSILPPRRIPLSVLVPTIHPNAEITVDGFVDALTNTTSRTLCHSRELRQQLDTLGDKIMTPVVYQNRSGTESLWADVLSAPTQLPDRTNDGVRWYQFDVTGGNFPATPVQQQDWTNRRRRFMALDAQHSGRSKRKHGHRLFRIEHDHRSLAIRYAGRLVS